MAVLSCVDLKQYSIRGNRMENKIKALTVALENELHERDFYLAQSEKTDNPVGKKMFLQIAAEEDEHYRRLQRIHEDMSRQGTWPDTVSNICRRIKHSSNVQEDCKPCRENAPGQPR